MEWTQEERDKEQKRLTDAMPQKCPNCGRNWSEWDGSGLWRCWKEQGGCGYGMTNSPDDSENMQTRIRELLSEVDRLSVESALRQRDADTARAEVEKLRAELKEYREIADSKESILGDCGTLLCEHFGDRVYWERHEVPGGIQSLIEQIREESTDSEKLRAEVQSLRANAAHERLKRRRAEEWIRKWRERSDGYDQLYQHYLTANRERFEAQSEASISVIESAERIIFFSERADRIGARLDEAHAALWGMYCAAGNARARIERIEERCATAETEYVRARGWVEELRSLVAECRPVVEAVHELRAACAENDEGRADDAYYAITKSVKLPAMEGGE